MPVRDDAPGLRRLLARIDEQTRRPTEVVVVDNGSTDDSARIAREWGARVVREERVGIPFAARRGYDAATCDIIVRADADTVPGPGWIDDLVTVLSDRERVVAVTGPGRFEGTSPLVSAASSIVYMGAYYLLSGLALAHPPLFGTNLAFRRTWWERTRDEVSLRPDIHDDMDLSFRVRPGEQVLFRWGAPVTMSGRAMHRNRALRLRRGVRTVLVNWQREFPWDRWVRRHLRR